MPRRKRRDPRFTKMVGERIKHAREAAGLIQQGIAAATDVEVSTVGGWEIAAIDVTKKDGSKQSGRPTWLLGCTYVRMDTDDQGTVKIGAFPTTTEFDPGQLIASIEVEAPGVAAPPVVEEPATPEVPAPIVEEPTMPETPVTPAVEGPVAPVAPGGPTPAMVTITVTCPHCGKPITLTIPATAQ